MRSLLHRLSVVAGVLVAAVPAAGWACASCGCGDPTLLSMGYEQPFGGRFRMYSEGQYRTEASGTPQDGGTSLEEWSLNFGASYSFSRALALSVTVPALFRTLNGFDLSLPQPGRRGGEGQARALARPRLQQPPPPLPAGGNAVSHRAPGTRCHRPAAQLRHPVGPGLVVGHRRALLLRATGRTVVAVRKHAGLRPHRGPSGPEARHQRSWRGVGAAPAGALALAAGGLGRPAGDREGGV